MLLLLQNTFCDIVTRHSVSCEIARTQQRAFHPPRTARLLLPCMLHSHSDDISIRHSSHLSTNLSSSCFKSVILSLHMRMMSWYVLEKHEKVVKYNRGAPHHHGRRRTRPNSVSGIISSSLPLHVFIIVRTRKFCQHAPRQSQLASSGHCQQRSLRGAPQVSKAASLSIHCLCRDESRSSGKVPSERFCFPIVVQCGRKQGDRKDVPSVARRRNSSSKRTALGKGNYSGIAQSRVSPIRCEAMDDNDNNNNEWRAADTFGH